MTLISQKKSGQMPSEMTNLYVSNQLVEAHYNYTMIQERIFNYLIYYCQEYITDVRRGMPVHQLQLFSRMNDNEIAVPLLLKHISKPDEYDHVREACANMREVTVITRMKDRFGQSWKVWDGLINRVANPDAKERNNILIMYISKEVAELIVNLDRRADGTPINFTTFKYEICMSAKNKYTARIYKLLNSYKSRISYRVSMEDFRKILGIEGKFKNSEALKRCILRPVMNELKQYCDIWYECDASDFEIKEGKKVVGYNFTLLTHKSNLHYVKQKENLIYLFKSDYKFKTTHINKIRFIIDNDRLWKSLDWRMQVINSEIKKQQSSIRDVPAYVVGSLLNHFKDA